MNKLHSSLDPTVAQILHFAGDCATQLSLGRAIGQIFAYLYVSETPLSFEDIHQNLRLSKGSISVNLRALEEWEAIEKVGVKGSRKVHYRALRDLKKIAFQRILQGSRKRLNFAQQWIQDLEAKPHSETSKAVLQRMQEVKRFLASANRALSLLPKLSHLLGY